MADVYGKYLHLVYILKYKTVNIIIDFSPDFMTYTAGRNMTSSYFIYMFFILQGSVHIFVIFATRGSSSQVT